MHKRLLVSLLAVLLAAVVVMPSMAQQTGGTLIIGRGADSVTLSFYATAGPDAEVLAHTHETLFDLTPDGKIEPLLAESYRLSTDATALTVRLRRNVRFHDGTPFDAAALKWNYDYFGNPANAVPFRGPLGFTEVTSVDVVDSRTVRITTRRPLVPVLGILSHEFLSIHSPTAVEKAGGMRPPNGEPYGRSPVGTGPYRFKEWIRGDRLVIERNPDYWGEKPKIDQIVFRVIPDSGARVLALEAGQIHVARAVPPRETARLSTNRALRVDRTSSVRTIYVAFNNQRRPFTDVRVRQAFNYAIDKRALVGTIHGGAARISDAPIPPGIVGYAPIMTYPHDVAKAKALLAEAGFPSGLNVTMHHPTGRYNEDAQTAAAIQAQLREAGINARLATMEWATYLTAMNKPADQQDVELFMLGWGTVTGDADYALFSLFHGQQWAPVGSNRFFYRNPQVDPILERARADTNPATRAASYKQAMEIIMKDAPWIFLYSESQVTGVRREVQGLIVHPNEYIWGVKASLVR